MNKVIICGNLGQDPELRYTSNGTAVAKLRIATNENWTDNDGKRKNTTVWHNIVVWRKQAESSKNFLEKGSKVLVEGRLQTRSWEADGNTRYITEIVATSIQFMDRKPRNEPPPPEQPPF